MSMIRNAVAFFVLIVFSVPLLMNIGYPLFILSEIGLDVGNIGSTALFFACTLPVTIMTAMKGKSLADAIDPNEEIIKDSPKTMA